MRVEFRNTFLVLILLFTVSALSASETLAIAAGNNQTAIVGTAVSGVVCVSITSNGNPVSGVTVTWGSVTGGGSIAGATQQTDGSGIATLGSWTLGPVAGTNSITATSPGLNSVTFTANAIAPANLSIAAGNNQIAAAGTTLPGAVCALVTDASNNPVAGASVTWTNITGGGSITAATQTTGSNGIATLGSWTLGPNPGVNTITATSPGLNPVTFTATSLVPTQMAVAAGDNQIAPVNTAVPGIVCVVVKDASNTPVPNVSVTWGNITGGGNLKDPIQNTNASGIATLGEWILGPSAGTNTITATSPGLPAVTFVATAVESAGQQNAVLQWDNTLLQAIASTQTPPPIASRAMGMVHTAIFDAWAAYDEKALGTQLGGQLRRPPAERNESNKTAALSFAAYRVLVDLFPTQKAKLFDSQMAALDLDPTNTSTDTTTPAGVGNSTATAILNFRHTDGSNQLGDLNPGPYSDYTSYVPVNTPDALNDPNRWQPLRVNGVVQVFLTPQWEAVTPFAIGKSGTPARKSLLPKPPAKNPSKAFVKQSQDLLDLSAGLNDQTKSIAIFWADGGGTVTPPGHWLQFGQFVSLRDRHTLDDDVKMFFALGNAMMDAAIACWDCKRHYDSVRPISAIHFLFQGKMVKAWAGPGLGTQTINGATWQPYIPTPPFAEYVSGHSTFSAAGAEVLALFTRKQDFGLTATVSANTSPIEPNVPAQDMTLSWKTYKNAADQAGLSRRLGGIHFQDGDMQGRALGKKVGAIVYKKTLQFIAGKVKP